ncbi:MAG: glycosyltransferase family 2 protein [Candidatus Brockarchaeota archaeon]|nr:glycosyltransferase family 2 protein [Candidatus Brockarchaeota archaeon]
MPEVSVILPAHDEEENIGRAISLVHRIMKGLSYDHEIVVVDDGSSDNTFSEAVKARSSLELESLVKVVRYAPNRGKGYAIRKGFENSRGDYVVFIDSDLDISPNHLGHYVGALRGADIVAASKFHPDSRVESPAMRKVLSLAYHWLARLLLGISVTDTQAGLKAFKREALEKVMSAMVVKRYAFDAEVFAIAEICKFKVKELPVHINLRAGFSGRNVAGMLVDLLGIAYRKRVKHYYQKILESRAGAAYRRPPR